VVDLALLAKGFHIVVGPVPYNDDGPLRSHWDAVYRYLTEHGFSRKPVLEGAGEAAGEAYAWAIENPDKVACVYGENPVLRSHMAKTPPLDNLAPLARIIHDVRRKDAARALISEGNSHFGWGGMPMTVCRSQL
jgi:hypothetical protein